MAIYANCNMKDDFLEPGDKRSAREILLNAVEHVAKTGHDVLITGTEASCVGNHMVLITRKMKE